jgi:hypothetical protein
MSVHKIRNAFVILNSIDSTPEQRKQKISYLIRENINSKNALYGFDLQYPLAGIANRKEDRRIGHTLAELIKSQDWETAQDLLNDNHRIRNRWTRSGHHNPLDEMFNEWFSNAPEVFICDDCDHLELTDDGHWAYDGDRHICDCCTSDNYTWSDHQDTYISNEDWEEEQERLEEEEQDDSVIGDYHSSKRRLERIPSSFDQRKTPVLMGLELEMEVRSGDREDHAVALLDAVGVHKGYRYACLEHDGSLNNGFEMVTGWTGLDVHAEQLQRFTTPIRGLKSHDTSTCGLHVHICKRGMTLFHAVKMVLFINDSGNQRLIRTLARRDSSRYSQVKNKKASYDWIKNAKQYQDGGKDRVLQMLNNDRYEALNFQNSKTIEFRIFKGTLRYETIMACLEFTYAIWFFCRDTGTNQLTTENFLEFISRAENLSDTKYLRQYLSEKNWVLPELGTIKKNPRLETTAPSVFQLATNEL